MGDLNHIYLIFDNSEMVLVDIFEIHKIPDSLRQVLSEIVNGDFFEIYKIPNSIKSLMRCNLA